MHSIEEVSGQSLSLKRFEDSDDFALGTNHSDVVRAALNGPAQQAHVVAMATRDNDDVGSFRRVELLYDFVEVGGVNLAGTGESLLSCIGGPVVSHDDFESCIRGDSA